jgi:streptogramin lyase
MKSKTINITRDQLLAAPGLGLVAALLLLLALPLAALGQAHYATPYTFTTLAGNAGYGSADGTGSTARFWSPSSVAVDTNGNVYVADTQNHTIRKVTSAGVVTTLAGLAGAGGGSTDGTGSAARFNSASGVAVDTTGNVYVAEDANNTIRKVTPAGVVTTLAGLAVTPGSANGTGSAARFDRPSGVAVDTNGNVYVADTYNFTIRKVTPAAVVTTLAGLAGSWGSVNGTGGAARFNEPYGVAVDTNGNAYVADYVNCTIRKVTPAGVVTTLAGSASQSGSANGTGSAARFNSPSGVAVDSAGNLYVADTYNYSVRKVTPTGVVTTLAGLAGSYGSADGTGSAAQFSVLSGVAVDGDGNVYVADTSNDTIRKVTPAGVVTTLAGLAGSPGYADGAGSAAQFNHPSGVAVDANGNVYVADTINDTIRKVTPMGVVTTLAGLAEGVASADGTGSAARFNQPFSVAVDSAGNVYLADTVNNMIRKGTPPYFRFDTSAGSLTVSNGFFQMRLTGPSGSSVVVEASADLAAWTPVQTNGLPPAGLDMSVPLGTNQNHFFRARLAP